MTEQKNENEIDKSQSAIPKISVIIPACNAAPYLEDCVRSVLDGTFRDFELLIIDDGSTDDTLAVARRLAEEDDRVTVYTQENKGVGATRNRGIDLAKGEYIAFIDADDFVKPEYLEKLYNTAIANDLDWVVCHYYMSEKKARKGATIPCSVFAEDVIFKTRGELIEAREAVFYGPGWNNLFSNAMCLYRLPLLKESGLRISETVTYGEDLLFNYDWVNRISGFAYLKEPLYAYRQHQTSTSADTFATKLIEKEKTLLRELEQRRVQYWGNMTPPYRTFCANQIRNMFQYYVLTLPTYKERVQACGEVYDFLESKEMGAFWDKFSRRYRGDRWFGRAFFWLVKNKRVKTLATFGGLVRRHLTRSLKDKVEGRILERSTANRP